MIAYKKLCVNSVGPCLQTIKTDVICSVEIVNVHLIYQDFLLSGACFMTMDHIVQQDILLCFWCCHRIQLLSHSITIWQPSSKQWMWSLGNQQKQKHMIEDYHLYPTHIFQVGAPYSDVFSCLHKDSWTWQWWWQWWKITWGMVLNTGRNGYIFTLIYRLCQNHVEYVN